MLKLYTPAGGVRLEAVLEDAGPFPQEFTVHSCCSDSRQVKPGDLFVSIVGPDFDGHDFVDDAVARGAAAILAERPLPNPRVPQFVVPDTRDAYGRLCQALSGWPADDLKLIGVTGTSGKTTTTSLIASVLNMGGGRSGVLGTLGYSDGQTTAPAPQSTPPPTLLAKWLGQMTASFCTHAVVEVSSRALARQNLAGVSLDTACITNITRAHLQQHNTLENYRRTKERILDLLRSDGLAVFNADDPVSMRLISDVNCQAITVGIEQPADITATVIERNLCDQSFLLHVGDETAAVRTRLLGDHHVSNCLEAAAVGVANGIDVTTIAPWFRSGRWPRWPDGADRCRSRICCLCRRRPHAPCIGCCTTNASPGDAGSRVVCVRIGGGRGGSRTDTPGTNSRATGPLVDCDHDEPIP